tara:strand:+ start:193 stop:456 length:264 start_codon:yes stop_codon:yes gene_type:complete
MDNELDNGWDKELVNEHNRFRMKHLVGDRTFDKDSEDGIWIRKNVYDCSCPGDDEIDSVIIDNKYEKKYYHTTLRNEEGKWVHILSE